MQARHSSIPKAALCVAVSAPLILAAADWQTRGPESIPILRAETRVVQVDVVITDSDGKPVADLRNEDFTLIDNGKPRRIDIFSVSTGNPAAPARPTARPLPPNVFSNRNPAPSVVPARTTIVVLDATPADPQNEITAFHNAQAQARGRIQAMLPDEKIALFAVSRQEGLLLLQDYTDNRDLLLSKLASYTPRALHTGSPWLKYEQVDEEYRQPGRRGQSLANTSPPDNNDSSERGPNDVPARETQYMIDNSVRENRLSLQTLAERLALLPGRKNVFCATAGFPPLLMHGAGQFAWDKTMTALNEANVAVNTGACSLSSDEIARRTGGTASCQDDPNALAVTEAARTSYTLGFYLQDSERDDTFHLLMVRVDRPHVQAFYRQGYFDGAAPKSLQEKKPELESVLLNLVDSTDVGITARVVQTAADPRGNIAIRLNLDPATLSLSETPRGWRGNVEEEVVEMNESGNTLAKISDRKTFQVTAANRAGYENNGANWPLSIPLMQGATRIAIVVRDSKTGHIGSLTIPLL